MTTYINKLIVLAGVLTLVAITSAAAQAQSKKGGESKGVDDTGFFASDKTTIDFSDTLIEGQMKAPTGFYIQGRKSQSLSQMVKLRSNFRSELRNSKAALRSLAK